MKRYNFFGECVCNGADADWEVVDYPKHIFTCTACGSTIQNPEYVNLITYNQITRAYIQKAWELSNKE